MTTKYKIILGFVCMMGILVAISALGYRTMHGVAIGFYEYARRARTNVELSNALASFNDASIRVNTFLATRDAANIVEAMEHLDAYDKKLENALREITNPQRQEAVNALRKTGRDYKDKLGRLAADVNRMTELFQTRVLPSRAVMEEILAFMSRAAHQANNTDLLLQIVEVGAEAANLRYAMANLVHTRSDDQGRIAAERIATIANLVGRMKEKIIRPEVHEAHAKLDGAVKTFAGALAGMIDQAKLANAASAELRVFRAALDKDLRALSAAYDDLMRAGRRNVTSDLDAGQTELLFGGIAGIAIGLVASLLIITGLIRVLREMSLFAQGIADGDFQVQARSRENGEVGSILRAMKAIPPILEKLGVAAAAAADKIAVGDYRHRPDASAFPGSYRELVQSINMVSDAYTKTLDHIPCAIITCDLDYNMLYINDVSKAVLGSDMTGRNCGKCFKAPICNTDKCFAHNARATGKPFSGEVDIYPDSGVNLWITVTSIPFYDKNGMLAGHLEICTDLTEAEARKRNMMKVAEQARAISDRVAAATEELSAQVEQVSQGAEQQRGRVENTVAAMTRMNSTVLDVAKSAGQASEQSEVTKTKAGDGAGVVNQVVRSINMVNKVAVTLQTNMQDLGKQAESIGGVMNVISDIADQTNLLALNAAIEAARAGEAGRGFAVVADEVRKLAEKTMSATQEVGANISAIQNSARTNIQEVGEAAKAITEATELANTSGQALSEIVDLASANSSVVASIATAAEEQSAASEEINQALEEINRITGETADGMHQSSEALHELSRTAQELHGVIEQLK